MTKAVCIMKTEARSDANVPTGFCRSAFHASRRDNRGANASMSVIDTLENEDVRIGAVLRRFASVDEEGITGKMIVEQTPDLIDQNQGSSV